MSRDPRRPARSGGLIGAAALGEAHPIRLWQLALAVLAGNLALHQLPALPGRALVLGLMLLALGWAARTGLRRPGLPAIALLAFCFTALAADDGLAARWPPEADGRDVELTGFIDGLPTTDPGRTVFSLRIAGAATEVPLRRVRLSWYEPAPALEAGQALAVVARLRAPRGLVNPGTFDYERWLFLERYDATGYVRSGRIEERRYGLAQAWLELRAGLVERLGGLIANADAAALITALALGERGGFSDSHWTVLQRTGTSHLVAVSGLHIGLIAALGYWLAFRLALRLPYPLARRAHGLAAALCIVPAAVYAALAGFGLPTRRALVMLLVAQCLVIARRRWPLAGGLALALILVLALDPLASLTASFWLSFGAVAWLLAAAAPRGRPGGRRPPRPLAWAGELGRLQWALTLGLAPLVVWFFGQVAPASFFVNLVAIPLFSFIVVPLALVTAALAALGTDGFGLAALAGEAAGLAWRGLELAAAVPFAAVELPRPPFAALVVAVAALMLALPRHRLPGRRLALLGLAPLAFGGAAALAPGEARVTVLDVGQGLAVAIETASHRLLYDAGPVYRSGFDAGAEIVAPALARLGSRPLDLIVLSHADSDHSGGAPAVIARYPDAAVLAGPDAKDASIARCVAGQAWRWDEVGFSILHPPPGFAPLGNESSCVLGVETIGGRLLVTGDIERRAEAGLAGDSAIAADVVIVPHHGSQTSSTPAFVAGVGPRLAIVSAGFGNRWGFPRPEVRQRWEGQGAVMLVTGDHGAIELGFGADGLEVEAARHSRRRYWQAKREPVSGVAGVLAL